MYSLVQSLCCCTGEGSDDEGPLISDTDGHFGTSTPCDSTNRFWVNDAEEHMTPHAASNGSFRQGSDEDELLNQILEATQQNIIDVANMDGTTTPYKEDLSKAQRYSDAIRQHDLRVRKHALNTTPEDDSCFLFDVGHRVIEVLQRSAQTFTMHSDLRDFAGNVSSAVVNGIQIEHRQDILIHMTFSDE
uniref:Late endosomal/lysosomal adaptor and MAPK and MTOR activator 1 n=1 Tax=Elaeophora elaphi TaxID=1147741 RepID=A0A0R3RQ48_9BILA